MCFRFCTDRRLHRVFVCDTCQQVRCAACDLVYHNQCESRYTHIRIEAQSYDVDCGCE